MAIVLSAEEDIVVRSGAVRMAITTVEILEEFPDLLRSRDYPDGVRAVARQAVIDAIPRGLDSMTTEMAQEFIAAKD